jgi:Sulfotransferase family
MHFSSDLTINFVMNVVTVAALRNEDGIFLQLLPHELAHRWKSNPECKNFYSSTTDARLVWENDGIERLFGTDVIVCPEHKLVYVDNVKAGSTTIRTILEDSLGCSWISHSSWLERDKVHRYCAGVPVQHCRSTSRWLHEAITSNYTFFSVVRDPLQRFISGYKQALHAVPELRHLSISDYIRVYR